MTNLTYCEALVLSEALSQYLENSDPASVKFTEEPSADDLARRAEAQRLLDIVDAKIAGIAGIAGDSE